MYGGRTENGNVRHSSTAPGFVDCDFHISKQPEIVDSPVRGRTKNGNERATFRPQSEPGLVNSFRCLHIPTSN